MKKILYTLLIILGFLFVINLPFLSGIYDKYFLKNTVDFKLSLLKNTLQSPDIIFFGSSNSEQGFNTQILEDEYNKLSGKNITAFNFSIPAAMYLENFYLLKYLVEHNKKPKLVVLHYVPKTEFIYTKNIFYASYFTYDKVVNLYDLYDLSKSYIDRKSLLEFYFAYFYKPYLYRGVLFDNLVEFYSTVRQHISPELNFTGMRTRYSIRGDLESKYVLSENKFTNNEISISNLVKNFYNKKIEFNEKHQYAFNKIIKYAKENNIEVLITNVPEVIDLARNEQNSIYLDYIINENRKIYQTYAKEKDVHFIDLIGDNKFNLFDSVDGHHLTYNTSLKLTKLLVNKMYSDDRISALLDSSKKEEIKIEQNDIIEFLAEEKNPFKLYKLIQYCYDKNILLEKKDIAKFIKNDNDYLSIIAMDYLFKFFKYEQIKEDVFNELKYNKSGGPYNISRYENILNNMIKYNYIFNEEKDFIENIQFADFLRLNIVFKYLTETKLDSEYRKSYIDNILLQFKQVNSVENVETIIYLYNLIQEKGTKKQLDELKDKILSLNMPKLLLYLENDLYNVTLK